MNAWDKLIEHTPVAAALIYVVVQFLRAMARRDLNIEKQQERWFETNQEEKQSMRGTLESNTEALQRVVEASTQLLAVAREIREQGQQVSTMLQRNSEITEGLVQAVKDFKFRDLRY